ncbi:hypothetical protein [Pseudomonas phage vB_PseuGesM_254]|uniref:Uncharacterized protein n=1 Tax=Pseudomonas phage vB_PseuGesM_254 TaxID=3092638 RepID=A0AAX4G7W2_9CAUD|nr:hypothetical protein [Pseudomonas phage PseuGes_254]
MKIMLIFQEHMILLCKALGVKHNFYTLDTNPLQSSCIY